MKSKTLPFRSEGAIQLARTGLSEEQIAVRLRVGRSMAGHLRAGRRKAGLDVRRRAFDEFGIDPDAWDLLPNTAKKKAPTAIAEAAIGLAAAGVTALPPSAWAGSAREQAMKLQGMLRELVNTVDDPKSKSTPAERVKVMHGAAATLALLSKVTGESREITQQRIARTSAWEKICATLIAALQPWPEALRATGEALAKIEE